MLGAHVPVEVEGSYFCIVPLKVSEVETIFRRLFFSLLSERQEGVTNRARRTPPETDGSELGGRWEASVSEEVVVLRTLARQATAAI